MKYIFLNLKSFIKNERMIFFITILCVISSAFIVNFSYGLYCNYNTKKSEAYAELLDLDPEIADGAHITKGQLQHYVESLSDKTLDGMIVIFCAADVDEFNSPDGGGTLYMRFVIHDGKYGICEVTKENWERNGLIYSGRYLTNEEEENGSMSAMISIDQTSGEPSDATKNITNPDGTISFLGNNYEVVGTYCAGGGTPIVPFKTVPDTLELNQLGFSFTDNIKRSVYDEMYEKAVEQFGADLIFPSLPFPDSDTISIYNNMIAISFAIAALSMINFAMLYRFILKKREKTLAIFRICGLTKAKAARLYFGECAILILPCYVIGAAINVIVTKTVFANVFEHMAENMTVTVYALLFLVYLISFVLIVFAMLLCTIDKEVAEGV